MKLGDVLKKEREAKGLSVEETAEAMGIPEEDYRAVEGGNSTAEDWAPLLAELAIRLEVQTARLISETGRSSEAAPGEVGSRIRQHRDKKDIPAPALAEALGIPEGRYGQIEAGDSPLEQWGPQLLAFAEAIDQPVFNLFYPCGLPFAELEDYP